MWPIFGFLTVALITWLSANTLERALRDLRGINEELDERVELRTLELASANERLLELDKLKSKFVSDVTHELRTPVSNLTIYLEMLQAGENSEQSQKYLSVLQEETNRLRNLVTDVFDVTKIGLSLDKTQFERVNINLIVEKTVLTNQLRAQASGLKVEMDLNPEIPDIHGNADQINQIISNLMNNAINYTERGTISVRTYPVDDDQIALEIEDTGIGISEEDKPHVFERFYRGQRAGQSNIPGTGLGLAIIQELVSNHGGWIELTSSEGEGSRFIVYFPVTGQTDLKYETAHNGLEGENFVEI